MERVLAISVDNFLHGEAKSRNIKWTANKGTGERPAYLSNVIYNIEARA